MAFWVVENKLTKLTIKCSLQFQFVLNAVRMHACKAFRDIVFKIVFEVTRVVSNSVSILFSKLSLQFQNIISNSVRMYNLTVNVSKLSDGARSLTPPPSNVQIEGFYGKGVKYRSASKNRINPYLIILFEKRR